MNYQRIYDALIQRAKDETRKKLKPANPNYKYYESHHIIPVCMGGLNNKENLILFTAEEHYVAHQLLVKIYPENRKLIHAANMMSMNTNGKRPNNRSYGWLRRRLSESLLGRTPHNKGKKACQPSLKKGIPSGRKGIPNLHNKGKPSPFKGTKSGKMPPNKGHPSPLRGIKKETIICPYCGSVGGTVTMNRNHFDNCLENPINKANFCGPIFQKTPKVTKKSLEIMEGKKSGPNKKKMIKTIMITCPHCNKYGESGAMHRWHLDNCPDNPANINIPVRISPLIGKMSPKKGKSYGTQTNPEGTNVCPHCGKEGRVSSMKRRHFDKCKFKPDNWSTDRV